MILKPFSNIQISLSPDSFMAYASKLGDKRFFGFLRQDFSGKIFNRYRILSDCFRLQLYFLRFPSKDAFLNYLFFPLSILLKNRITFNRFTNDANRPYGVDRLIKEIFDKAIYNNSAFTTINFLYGRLPLSTPSVPNIVYTKSNFSFINLYHNKLMSYWVNPTLSSKNAAYIMRNLGFREDMVSSTLISEKIVNGLRDHYKEVSRDEILYKESHSGLDEKGISSGSIGECYFPGFMIGSSALSDMILRKLSKKSLKMMERIELSEETHSSKQPKRIPYAKEKFAYVPAFIIGSSALSDVIFKKLGQESQKAIERVELPESIDSIGQTKRVSYAKEEFAYIPTFMTVSTPLSNVIFRKLNQVSLGAVESVELPENTYSSNQPERISYSNEESDYVPKFTISSSALSDVIFKKLNQRNLKTIEGIELQEKNHSSGQPEGISFSNREYTYLPSFIISSSIVSSIKSKKRFYSSADEYKGSLESKILPEQPRQSPGNYLQKINYRDLQMAKQFSRQSEYSRTFPPVKYFRPNLAAEPGVLSTKSDKNSKLKSLSSDYSSLSPDKIPAAVSVEGDNLYNLADRIYKIIVDRVKREREIRGY